MRCLIEVTERLGFFRLTTLVMDYENDGDDDLSMQSLLIFEPRDKLGLVAGAGQRG